MFRFKAFIISILFSLSATAEQATYTSTISKVYPLADGGFIVAFKEDSPNCPRNLTPKYHSVEVGKNGVTQEGLNLIFSAALAAGASGKPVTIVFDGSSENCYINRLSVNF
ncbi:response regulator receiver protein [Microbulbifer epialgicus]|uniref:Response regulator receiver protein n=1 Tax=Microbulbifer epialgicus TaxID=393907 RepID=A0ABV4P5L4_9GAMM